MNFVVYGKRFGREEVGLGEFITPNTPAVIEVVENILATNPPDLILAMWDWCCKNIKYPPTKNIDKLEYTTRTRFLTGTLASQPLLKDVNDVDFWQFPFETLALPRYGDCEDISFVLCSMLLRVMPRGDIRCVVGTLYGWGHCWVSIFKDGQWYIIDPTLPKADDGGIYSTPEGEPYTALIKFDDQTAEEIEEGYEQFMNAPVNEEAKQARMLRYYDEPEIGDGYGKRR